MKQLITILIFLAFSYLSANSQSTDADTATIKQLELDVVKAYIAGDSQKISRAYADDYEGYSNGGYEDKKMILSDVQPMTGITINNLQMNVNLHGTTAVVNAVWEMKASQGTAYRQYMDVLVKQEDGWKFIGSSNHPLPVYMARDMEDSEFTAITAASCTKESVLKSLNSDVQTYLRIKNNTKDTLTQYWINYDGKRDPSPYQIYKIAPGKSLDRITYVTHPFIVVDSKGKCYGIYQATAKPSIGIIKN